MLLIYITKTGLLAAMLLSAPGLANACPLHDKAHATPIQTAAITPPVTISSTSLPPRESEPARPLRPLVAASPDNVDDKAGTAAAIAPKPAAVVPAQMSAQAQLKPEKMAENMTKVQASKPADQWNARLSHYLAPPDSTGLARFDYAGLKNSPDGKAALTAYIEDLESQNLNDMSDNEAIAYWANLYNAVTIQVVTENYPVKSIKDIKAGVFSSGPWKKDLINVGGEDMSLDDVEHGTLREKYPSPLIHYMVNCASIGCPNLKDGLWTANTLEADRKMAARAYINSPRGAKVTDKGLVVSSIYKWFEEDFGGNKQGVLDHLANYAEDDLKAAINKGGKITGYAYDWALNE